MLNNLIISFSICYTITKLTVITHEIGHIFALYITKKKLNLELQTVTSIFTFGLYGKTFSPIYTYLEEHRDKEDIQKLIKFNASMGLVFEIVFLTLIATLSNTLFSIVNAKYVALSVILFTFSLIIYLFSDIFKKSTSDIKCFYQPETFTYLEVLPTIKGKNEYILIPVGLFLLSSVIALIRYTFVSI